MAHAARAATVDDTIREVVQRAATILHELEASSAPLRRVDRVRPDVAIAFERGESGAGVLTEADRTLARRFRHGARRTDFLLGRTAAANALAALGADPAHRVGVGPNGEPLWPDGYGGSISHAAGAAAAVVVRAGWGEVGIDIESARRPVDPEVAGYVAGAGEFGAIAQYAGDEFALYVTFSLKEAAIKAMRPARGSGVDFRRVLLGEVRREEEQILCGWRFGGREGRARAVVAGGLVCALAAE